MGEKNIGVVLIIEDDVLKGILSEKTTPESGLKNKASRKLLFMKLWTKN
jgi:hypothetical protein